MSPAEFCREIEAYLCRKNDGHLIRIVGPVFGTVTGWAEQGIPLKVAFQGIDRYFDRTQKRGVRRRPVPIQFCEADILDAFDDWRRALGLTATAARSLGSPSADVGGEGLPTLASPDSMDRASGSASANPAGAFDAASVTPAHARRKAALQLHIDRVMARLTQRRVDVGGASAFGDAIDRILGQLDALRADAKGLRGDARDRVVEALAALDREMLDAALATLDAAGVAGARAEAARELDPFRSRMPAEVFARALEGATDRLVRERLRLPIVRVDE